MADFDRTKFSQSLTSSAVFTTAQIAALVQALQVALDGTVVPGESHEAAPLRGAAPELS